MPFPIHKFPSSTLNSLFYDFTLQSRANIRELYIHDLSKNIEVEDLDVMKNMCKSRGIKTNLWFKVFFYKFYIIFWEIKGNYKLLKFVFACWQYFITSYGTFPWNAPTIGQFYVPFVDIQSFFNYLHTNKYSNGPGNFFNANLKAEFIYSILWDSSFSITFETCDNRVWEKFTLKKTDSTPNTQWDSFTCSSQITIA